MRPNFDILRTTRSRYLFRKVQVFRCRLIRTVVNLSLIIVMTIQAAMALALTNECSANDYGASRASSFTCEGCRCCEVPSPEEKCGCCGSGEPAIGENSCCMGDTESDAARSDSAMSDTSVEAEVTSTCGCGVKNPPLGDSGHARPSISTREFVAIRHSDLADLFGAPAFRTCPSSVRGEDFLRPAHFSQIQLGIWRL